MSKEEENYFEQGQSDARGYYSSQALAGLTRYIKPEDAIRIYWPPVEESLMMVSTPMPKSRQKWIAGFRKEQMIIMAENQLVCKSCGTSFKQEKKDE